MPHPPTHLRAGEAHGGSGLGDDPGPRRRAQTRGAWGEDNGKAFTATLPPATNPYRPPWAASVQGRHRGGLRGGGRGGPVPGLRGGGLRLLRLLRGGGGGQVGGRPAARPDALGGDGGVALGAVVRRALRLARVRERLLPLLRGRVTVVGLAPGGRKVLQLGDVALRAEEGVEGGERGSAGVGAHTAGSPGKAAGLTFSRASLSISSASRPSATAAARTAASPGGGGVSGRNLTYRAQWGNRSIQSRTL